MGCVWPTATTTATTTASTTASTTATAALYHNDDENDEKDVLLL